MDKVAALAVNEGEVSIRAEGDIVAVRRAVREAATRQGFGTTDVTRIMTAASELARNVYLYAGSGTMRWRLLNVNDQAGIELLFQDNGPGIPDVAKAMQPGYSISGGLGLGLPGTKRLMDEMKIDTEIGKGTRVMVRKWQKK